LEKKKADNGERIGGVCRQENFIHSELSKLSGRGEMNFDCAKSEKVRKGGRIR